MTASIRPGTNRVGDKNYPQFTLIYFFGNTRIRKRFATLEAAKKEAELIATKLANGENEVLKLSPADCAIRRTRKSNTVEQQAKQNDEPPDHGRKDRGFSL